ncbi:MAG: hypothetical protein PUD50_01700 [Eubacteriales bacterium]|nr:hypothetical protein [Eubacteriales bacterium]
METTYLDWMGTNIAGYLRKSEETSDADRIQRAIEDHPHGVIVFPKGVYTIDKPIRIQNHCSLQLAKEAVFLAVAPMEYMVEWNGGMENLFHDYGMFIQGGTFDGAAMAGGVRLRNIHHFTMRDSWYKDCKVGLCVGDKADYKNYELCAYNLYMRNSVGIPDSVGVCIPSHADHYLDSIIVVDYQTGFFLKCGSTYMSKCHSWVTNVIPDMSKTIAFDLAGGGNNTLTDCYVDTSQIGVRIRASNCRMQNVFGFHNGKCYGGRNHVFLSYETDAPFYLNGGNFIGCQGCDDIFFRGEVTPNLHMQWVSCQNLRETQVLEECKKNG